MAKQALWAEVEDMTGGVVKLTKGQKIISRRSPGRPRVKPLGASYHYNWVMKTPAGVGMRCRNVACSRMLKSQQHDIVCSEPCRMQLLRYCEETLEVLHGKKPAKEYPPDLRGQKNSMAKRRAA